MAILINFGPGKGTSYQLNLLIHVSMLGIYDDFTLSFIEQDK